VNDGNGCLVCYRDHTIVSRFNRELKSESHLKLTATAILASALATYRSLKRQ